MWFSEWGHRFLIGWDQLSKTSRTYPYSYFTYWNTFQVEGQPSFTVEQASKALQAYKERKKARQKAREEEACYVEYRKAEILSKFKPKVGTLGSADEVSTSTFKGSIYLNVPHTEKVSRKKLSRVSGQVLEHMDSRSHYF